MKLKKITLTTREWLESMKMPMPQKNKKKYNRKKAQEEAPV